MPLVKRHIKVTADCTFATTVHPHVMYVPPGQVKKKDEVVAPTDRQLADLAARYPEEFGAEAKKRGVAPTKLRRERGAFVDVDADRGAFVDDDEDGEEGDDDADDEGEDDEGDEGEQEGGAITGAAFAKFDAKRAANVIAATDDEAALTAWFSAEQGREGGPRATVLAAFAKKAG